MDAVKVALDFEAKGYEFYRKAAVDATDDKEKKLFSALADEEQEHYSVITSYSIHYTKLYEIMFLHPHWMVKH